VRSFNRARLDFFLISPELIDWVGKVKYEDRLGSDFDHKEVMLQLGEGNQTGKISIGDGLLEEPTVEDISNWAVYDSIANHLQERDGGLVNNLAQYQILISVDENIRRREELSGSTPDLVEERNVNTNNIRVVKNRLPNLEELLGRGLTCDYRNLYEIIMIGVKTNLTELQKRVSIRDNAKRDWLIQREEYMSNTVSYTESPIVSRFHSIH
jgi:hypothetical protein